MSSGLPVRPVNFPEKVKSTHTVSSIYMLLIITYQPLYNRQSPCHESFKKGGKDSGVAIQDDILHIVSVLVPVSRPINL